MAMASQLSSHRAAAELLPRIRNPAVNMNPCQRDVRRMVLAVLGHQLAVLPLSFTAC